MMVLENNQKFFLTRGRLFGLLCCFFVLVLVYKTFEQGNSYDPIRFVGKTKTWRENRFSLCLKDVLLADVKPPPGRTIFFHETQAHSPESHYILNLTARQACAIESAAFHNTNFRIYLLIGSETHLPKEGEQPLVDAILSYENVELRRLQLTSYAKNTPIEDWLKKGDLSHSKYPTEHTSDLLRLLTLYRFGGIYLDHDVVVLRSLESLPLNYVCAHDDSTLGNGVISLEPDGVGHEIGEIFLRDYAKNFNGDNYVGNGPSLITRVMRGICKTNSLQEMREDPKRCRGFKVLEPKAFFAVPSDQWSHFFEPEFLQDVLNKTKDSYGIHLWNKASYKRLVKVGTDYAFGKYAKENCPKTFEAAGEYF